jgi:flagellar basal-body rod protein FlgG
MMVRGLYISASGMNAMIDQQNAIANNLANADTVAFKRDSVSVVPFSQMMLNAVNKYGTQPIGTVGLGVMGTTGQVDFTNGIIFNTGNMYDLAINGQGMFAVQTANGTSYTRAGNFKLDKDGYLVTQDGQQVLGQNGPIQLSGSFQVLSDGTIMQGNQVVDQLQIVSESGMVKAGHDFTASQPPKPASGFTVVQGALERSNINPINEMIQMITVSRNYEANSKVLAAHDETLNQAVNNLAK